MATINDILNFAFTHKVFTPKELLANIKDRNPVGSLGSLLKQINRLLKSGQIIRPERGVYSLPNNIKRDFFINCSGDIRSIDLQLKKQLPFADFCIWDSSAIMSYILHIPDIKFRCLYTSLHKGT
jgi:hypothetical protein